MSDLGTTNLFLGIMAAVSVLEILVVAGAAIAIFVVYRRVTTLIDGIEARHIAPAMGRVNAILDDFRFVSARVKEESERVDQAIRSTIERVDDTADRVRSNVRAKASWIIGALRGLRTAIEEMLASDPRRRPPARAAGRVM